MWHPKSPGQLITVTVERYRPKSYWHDQVAIGQVSNEDNIHRVIVGFVQPMGVPLDDDMPAADFETACGLSLMGRASHAIMNMVDCRPCWEVPLVAYDAEEQSQRIIGRRDPRR